MLDLSLTTTLLLLAAWAAIALAASALWARFAGLSVEKFMVASRGVPGILGAASLLASWTWALSINAPAQAAYNFGIAGPLYFGIGGGLMLVMLAPFASRIRTLAPRGHTLPEFIGQRHGSAARATILCVNLLSVGVLLFLNLSVVGYVLETFTPLSYAHAVLIVAGITVAYTAVSGIGASMATDAIQLVVITVAAILVVPPIVREAGGIEALRAAAPSLGEKMHVFSRTAFLEMGLPFLIMSVVSPFSYPSLWQIAWAVREKEVKRSYVQAGLAYIPYGIVFGALGLWALVAHVEPGAANASDIAPVMAGLFLSPALKLVFVCLVLAAACSSCDSSLSAFSALFMNDLYLPHLRPGASEAQTLRAGRIAMVCYALAVALLAVRKVSLLDAVFFLGAAKGAMVFPLLASLYWGRMTQRGFIVGIVGGMMLGAGLYLGLQHVTEYYRAISVLSSIAAGTALCVGISVRRT